MAPQIPIQFRFEEMLSHTFPGFFSALTLFMLIDVLSPINLTQWAIKDVTSLLSFVGFVILMGTILGVIIDGIHHNILEIIILEKEIICRKDISELKEINESLKALRPSVDLKLNSLYFFKLLGDKAIDIFEYLETTYSYSEFYANTSISLFPLSFIAPFYLVEVLKMPWIWSISLSLASFIIACCCLSHSFTHFKDYQAIKLSVLCGYLEKKYFLNLKAKPNFELETTIFDKESQQQIFREGVVIIFKTTLGIITPINEGKTDSNGIARATLYYDKDKNGTAIVTAISKNCIPGITRVQFRCDNAK